MALCAVFALLPAAVLGFAGSYFSGSGAGDADEWLNALETARMQFNPNPTLQDYTQLYYSSWNGMVEGPTWGAWWTTNACASIFYAHFPSFSLSSPSNITSA